ncbi:MAG: primosomal protein [Candidatus Thorarchaeota archaeon]
MNSKLVLTEWVDLEVDKELLAEAEESGKPLILQNKILQRAEIKNFNGRIYPKDILVREVNKYKKLVQDRRALGELDHPDSPIVELKNVALLITDIDFKNNDVIGSIEILNTPSGRILRDLAKQNVKLGISSRGTGTLKREDGSDYVQDDFELIAFDAVSSPSTSGAYIIGEGKVKRPDEYSGVRKILFDILGKDFFK